MTETYDKNGGELWAAWKCDNQLFKQIQKGETNG